MTAELAGITGPGTAFLAGLVTSLHCAGMCGPLACALMPAARDDSDPQVVASAYHLTRLAGYSVLGALAGGVGRLPLALLGADTLRYLPWLLVVFFVSSSVLSHVYEARKSALAEKFSKGSRRDLAQALANGGAAALVAIANAAWPHPAWWAAFAGAIASVKRAGESCTRRDESISGVASEAILPFAISY